MKLPATIVCALVACALVVCGGSCAAQAQDPANPPDTESAVVAETNPAGASPRDLLALVGLDAAFFAGFADDQPLDEAERQKIDRLLYRLARIPPLTMEEFQKPRRTLFAMAKDPAQFRGDVCLVVGYVKNIEREELSPEAREKFGFDARYRCRIVSYWGTTVTVYATSIPHAWTTADPLGQRAAALAMFVKLLPPGPDDPHVPATGSRFGIPVIKGSPLLVAERLAWYPNTLLGELGMDASLFDKVRDRTRLDERECFYQLLAAVRRADAGRIESVGRGELEKRRAFLERLARNRELGPKAHAAAQRAFAAAEQGADDVVPLFNDPAGQRGKLLVLPGVALRAIEIRVDDPDIVKRFGIDHYYEIEIVTADSQNNPIVCCVAHLPPDMPQGQAIHENVRVTGFFMKSWAFDSPKSRDAAAKQQLAPLLIANTVEVLASPTVAPPGAALAIAVVVAIVVCAVASWFVKRGDRRAIAQAAPAGDLPPIAPAGWEDASHKTG